MSAARRLTIAALTALAVLLLAPGAGWAQTRTGHAPPGCSAVMGYGTTSVLVNRTRYTVRDFTSLEIRHAVPAGAEILYCQLAMRPLIISDPIGAFITAAPHRPHR